MPIRLSAIAACALLFWPSQSDAQIYAWRDANGTLVLSDRKPDTAATTKNARAMYMTMRPVYNNSRTVFDNG